MVESSVWKDKCAGRPLEGEKLTDPGGAGDRGSGCGDMWLHYVLVRPGYVALGIHSEALFCYAIPFQNETEAEGVAGTR